MGSKETWKGALTVTLSVAALVWALAAFGQEMLALARSSPPPAGAPPSFWTLGSPAVEPLASLLEPLDRQLPAGRRVALASNLTPSEDFFLSMWCAYLLARHDVVRAFHQPSLPAAEVLITFGAPVEALDLPGVAPRATLLTTSPPERGAAAVFLYQLTGAPGP